MHPFWLRNSVVYNHSEAHSSVLFTYENYITSPRRLGRSAYAIFAHLVNLFCNLLFSDRRYSSRSRPNGAIFLQLDTMCMVHVYPRGSRRVPCKKRRISLLTAYPTAFWGNFVSMTKPGAYVTPTPSLLRRVTLLCCHVAPFRTTYTSSVGYERSDSVAPPSADSEDVPY